MSEEKKPIVYDPNKKYTWKKDDIFQISGVDLNILLNASRAFLSTSEAQTVLLMERASSIVENVLESAVISGVATEVVEKPVKTNK